MNIAKLSSEKLLSLSEYFKKYLFFKIEQTDNALNINTPNINEFKILHKGFYVGIIGSNNKQICRVGFLNEDCNNIIDSVKKVADSTYNELHSQKINFDAIKSSTFYFSLIFDVVFINNGLSWNENEDGIYFMWGDKYKGLYLSYEVKRLQCSKIEVMNRLCSCVVKVPSNFWRLPEGLCFRLISDNFS